MRSKEKNKAQQQNRVATPAAGKIFFQYNFFL